MANPRYFADLIKRILKERGWRQVDLAKHLRINKASIGQWIRVETYPGDAKMRRLGKLADEDPKDLKAVKHVLKLQAKGADLNRVRSVIDRLLAAH